MADVSAHPLWSHHIHLTNQPISVHEAREFIRRYLLFHGWSLLVDDVALVVSELATNALAHARTPFTVTLTGFEGKLVVAVEDGSTSGPRPGEARPLGTAGRGLHIVECVSHDWGVVSRSTAGKAVWAEFDTLGRPLGRTGTRRQRLREPTER